MTGYNLSVTFKTDASQLGTSTHSFYANVACVKRPSNDTSDLSQKKPTATEDDDMSTVNAHTK